MEMGTQTITHDHKTHQISNDRFNKKENPTNWSKQASKLAQFVPETIQSCHVSGYQFAQYLGLLTI